MNHRSNQSDWDKILPLLEGVHQSAEELLRLSVIDPDSPENLDLEPLINWLRESVENRALYNQVRQWDKSLSRSLMQGPEPNPAFAERLKVLVSTCEPDSSPVFNSADPGRLDPGDDSSAGIRQSPGLGQSVTHGNLTTNELGGDPTNGNETGASLPGYTENRQPREASLEAKPRASIVKSGKTRVSKWWVGVSTVIATVAAALLVTVWWNSEIPKLESEYTATMLCEDALMLNPESNVNSAWNRNVEMAPDDRSFPRHLIRLQARAWKQMKIGGDHQGVVYNLIPQDKPSGLKAYVYVFRSDAKLDLPGQFSSHPVANRNYRFWSVACRQDLVFVLVFEGDEKRLAELVEFQQVG